MRKSNRLIPLVAPNVESGEVEYKTNDFEINDILGAGAFATVYKVTHKTSKQVFAMKQIKKDFIMQSRKIDQIKLEMQIMYQMDHENIIKLYSHFEDEEHVNLLMEMLTGGSVYGQIQKLGFLREAQAISYMRQILNAISYLHNQPKAILHRDIKPENILLDSNNIAKLADFGSANSVKSQNEKRNTFTGTKIYMAPEILENIGYDQTVDIWSLGVLIFELLSGDTPFLPPQLRETMSDREQMDELESNIKKVKLTFPSNFPALARDLVRKMLKRDPAQRITLKEILEHPWMKQHIESEEWQNSSELLTKEKRIEMSLKKFKEKKTSDQYLLQKNKFSEIKSNIINLKQEINQYEVDIEKIKLENQELKQKLEEIEKANEQTENQPLENFDDMETSASFDFSTASIAISPARIVKVEQQFNKLNAKIIKMQKDIIENESEIAKNQYKLDQLSNLEVKVKRERDTVNRLEKELLLLEEQKKSEYQKLEEILHAFTALNQERSLSVKKSDSQTEANAKYVPLLKSIVEKLKSIIKLHREMINNPNSFSIDDSRFSDEEDEGNLEFLIDDQLDEKLNELQIEYENKKMKMKQELKKEMKNLQALEEENQKLKLEAKFVQEKEQLIDKAQNILKNLDFSYQIKQEQIKDLENQKKDKEQQLQQLQDKFSDAKRKNMP